ncbi:MAG: helix-turn-helix transcriptional regulator [Myxococcales bacterium]|nr:helix-turn-helix transcriptional regulator [Myxococcales bacterium]
MPRTNIKADGSRIKELRFELGISQQALADKIGCAPRTIERMEGSENVTPQILKKLAQVFRIPEENLILQESITASLSSGIQEQIQMLQRQPLRKRLAENEECRTKFEQAQALAISTFELGRFSSLPYFTPHAISHCIKLETFLNEIIWWAKNLGDSDFEPGLASE